MATTQMKKQRGRLVGPTLERVQELGIDHRTQPGAVSMAGLSEAADAILKAGLDWGIDDWALEEVKRLEALAIDGDVNDASFGERKHALAAVRCASSQVNKHEVDLLLEEQRRERANSNGNSASRQERERKRAEKRAEARALRAKMKGREAGGKA